MRRIEREKRVIALMIDIYCRKRLKLNYIPEEYEALRIYAERRLDGCKFGEKKPACKRCPIHCYKPEMRERVREVMRWVGPRMIFYSPISAIRHLLNI